MPPDLVDIGGPRAPRMSERSAWAVQSWSGVDCGVGDDLWSTGAITTFEPPHALCYIEPDWARLAGQDPTTVTPMATEFLIEARSGGTCVVRVVTSAFRSGADWENIWGTSPEVSCELTARSFNPDTGLDRETWYQWLVTVTAGPARQQETTP